MFSLLWDWGCRGPPEGGRDCGWERRKKKKWEVDRGKTESEDEGKEQKGQCRKKTLLPQPPLWNQIHWLTLKSSAYKSNHKRHQQCGGEYQGFGLGNLSKKTQPTFGQSLFDCSDLCKNICRLLNDESRVQSVLNLILYLNLFKCLETLELFLIHAVYSTRSDVTSTLWNCKCEHDVKLWWWWWWFKNASIKSIVVLK